MRAIELPETADWSICVRDASDDRVLYAHHPERLLRTASVGKVFLLAEVSARLAAGELDPDEPLRWDDDEWVADSGLWYQLRSRSLPLADLCLLVGAVSDNLATNVLLRRVGIEPVRRMARRLGCAESALLDRVREGRRPTDPPTLSVGRADELSALLGRLHRGEVLGRETADRVLGWLATDTDLSMVAGVFGLDPLAHTEPDRGVRLVNKTGTIGTARIDIGLVSAGGRTLAYAAAANWADGRPEVRDRVLAAMREIGRAVADELAG
ncbi:serine hydrolase [Enemella evansiae]|uniref:serine hydrolase n=1 Tax=Enemella evansiae TaxID=2016499 RepID=UPI000B975C05|nr:serine hydrolase [Enemella evansiae]OYO08092.1 serine hydrolase [Enemella evansiae]